MKSINHSLTYLSRIAKLELVWDVYNRHHITHTAVHSIQYLRHMPLAANDLAQLTNAVDYIIKDLTWTTKKVTGVKIERNILKNSRVICHEVADTVRDNESPKSKL